ncbi:hypothetical protein Tco_0815072 [Tanacetum coccineum]
MGNRRPTKTHPSLLGGRTINQHTLAVVCGESDEVMEWRWSGVAWWWQPVMGGDREARECAVVGWIELIEDGEHYWSLPEKSAGKFSGGGVAVAGGGWWLAVGREREEEDGGLKRGISVTFHVLALGQTKKFVVECRFISNCFKPDGVKK